MKNGKIKSQIQFLISKVSCIFFLKSHTEIYRIFSSGCTVKKAALYAKF